MTGPKEGLVLIRELWHPSVLDDLGREQAEVGETGARRVTFPDDSNCLFSLSETDALVIPLSKSAGILRPSQDARLTW